MFINMNPLTGTFPDKLPLPPALEKLSLNRNQLHGPLPEHWDLPGNLTHLCVQPLYAAPVAAWRQRWGCLRGGSCSLASWIASLVRAGLPVW